MSVYDYVGAKQIYALWALEWEWQIFLGQSIGIDETNKYQLTFFSSMEIVGGLWALEWAWDILVTSLWALEWAWDIRVTSLRCV